MNTQEEPNWQDVERQAVSLIDKGRLFEGLGKSKEALASFDKAVTICRPVTEKSDAVALVLAQALDNKGNALIDLERPAEAMPCYDEAIQVHEGFVRGDGTWQDAREIAITVMNKGRALMHLGRSEEALHCMDRAVKSFHECRSVEDYARALMNCGEAFFRGGNFEEALSYYEQSIGLWEKAAELGPENPIPDHAYALFCKGDALHHLQCNQKALDFCDRSIAMNRAFVDHTHGPVERKNLAEVLNLRGHILTELGQTKEAQECFQEAARLKKSR